MKFTIPAFSGFVLFSLLLLNSSLLNSHGVEKVEKEAFINCQVQTSEDINLQLGDSYEIETLISCSISEVQDITWEPAQYLSCTDCLNPMTEPLEDICYTVTINFLDGCTVTDEFCVFLLSCEPDFSDNAINSIAPQQITDLAEIELEIARTQFIHIEIVEDDEVQYVIYEGWERAGLQTISLDFSNVPAGDHELRVRLYPEDQFISIVKL